jgi:NADH-quinone oxidoreductase subunit C
MSQLVLARLKEAFPSEVLATSDYRGDETAVIAREHIKAVCRFLRDEPDLLFDMPTDLTAVDYLGQEPRFEVVYHLYSTTKRHRVRLKARVPEDDPTIDSVVELWPGFNWSEREAYDLYGIRFVGHPDLRRILLYPEFVGHPLRKDYPKEGRQPLVRRDGVPE